MGKIINLAEGNIGEVARQQHRDQYATPLNGSSVGHGGQRFYGTGKLTVENEGLYVVGTANISGTLIGSGVNDFSGVNNLSGTNNLSGENHLIGPTDVAGDLELIAGGLFKAGATEIRPDGSAKFGLFDIAANGDLSSKGTLEIDGVTTLKKDLNVVAGGKIKAGNVTIDPSHFSGSVRFANGTSLSSTTGGIQVTSATGGGALVASNSAAALNVVGGGNVTANSAGVTLGGIPTTTQKPNLHVDPVTGRLSRSTAV